MNGFNDLSNEQRRQLIDVRQTFEVYQSVARLLRRRYEGSMRWLTRKGHDYLHRKRGGSETSLGPRSEETEAQYQAFMQGREEQRKRATQLVKRLDQMAPVNRALGLGRVPKLTARIVRQLDKAELLGEHVLVIGTNALFAYEAKAGVQCSSELLATADADLLLDVRRRISFLLPSVRKGGLLSQLQKVDESFQLRRAHDFRAFNGDGFLVDLIRPEDRSVMVKGRKALGDTSGDMQGAAIFGLQWLLNAPRFEAVVIGEDGYPLRVVTVDPRAFTLHKLWVSTRDDRDPIKKPRDRAQAQVVAAIAQRYLNLSFNSSELQALPKRLRELLSHVHSPAAVGDGIPEPGWE